MGNVKRQAILIGHPGPKEKRLPGVALDIQNIYGYLQTPRGGGWMPEEITVLWSQSKARILTAVQKVEADYLFVYYSGHGAGQLEWTLQGGRWELVDQRWLEVNTGEFIQDFGLLNLQVPCQHLICDSCRTRPGARIGGIPETLEQIAFSDEEFYAARSVLDEFICTSPPGRIIAHSTLDGQPAVDSENGGMFTLALLEGSLNWRTGCSYSRIELDDLVDYAKAVLGGGRNAQVPEIVFRDGALAIPVALDTPWPLQTGTTDPVQGRHNRGVQKSMAPMQDSANGWLALGGIALGAWLLSKLG